MVCLLEMRFQGIEPIFPERLVVPYPIGRRLESLRYKATAAQPTRFLLGDKPRPGQHP
jgi:hypothetical protein